MLQKRLSAFNKLPLRLTSILLALAILISAVAAAWSTVFADDGGFTLGLRWMGVDDSTDYVYDSAVNEERLVRLRVSYRNEKPSQGYAPGEMVITVNGLGAAVRNGTATPAALAADLASAGTSYYDWSYTYSSATDTYTFTNNRAVEAGQTLDGMFEIIWRLDSRATVDNYTTELSARMRTAYNEQTTSNTVTYSQSRVRDTYTVSHSAKPIYSAEGLEAGLPAGTTADDYTWANFTVNGSDTYNSLDVKDAERFDLYFPAGTILQSPAYSLTKTGKTMVIDGVSCECWSVTRDISNNTSSPYLSSIYAAFPKDRYDKQIVPSYVEIRGTYNEHTEEELLASHKLTINLADFGYMDIPGNIYSTSKQNYGMRSAYISAHCGDCSGYGAINHEHLFNAGREYSSSIRLALNVGAGAAAAGGYDVELTDDFLDVEMKNGQIRQLADDEYHFTSVTIPGTNSLQNSNGYPITPDVYPFTLSIRRAGQTDFEVYSTGVLTASSQDISLPSDTVAVRVKFQKLTETVKSNAMITLRYVFHTDDTGIRTDSGKLYNNMFIKLYDQSGEWLDGGYKDNPGVYGSEREYLRDINTYGTTFDREYDLIHILEVPNEFKVGNSFSKSDEDRDYFYFTGDIASSLTYLAGGTVGAFSQYTILPEGLSLSNQAYNEEMLLNLLTFSSSQNGVDDQYIREHCTIEIDRDYQGSGRTYIALHYDFTDAPISATSLRVSGIPMWVAKSDIETISATYSMRAAMLIDQAGGRWYSNATDASTTEGGIWRDIDKDGNTSEQASFYSSSASVVKPAFAELRLVKRVATTSTAAYESPAQNEDGSFNDADIPTEYFGNTYRYMLSLSTGTGAAGNIVLCDSLETGGEWRGKLISIDTSRAELELGVRATKWYSASVEDVSSAPDFTTGGWTTVMPENVRSFAIDFGEGMLDEGRTISIYVNMLAPEDTDGSLTNKLAINSCNSYFTTYDGESGVKIEDVSLPSNRVPVKLVPFTGTIRLLKRDATDQRTVSGARFSLYEMLGSAPNPATDTLVGANYVTNSAGVIITEKLLYGEYYFVETAAAPGYVLPENEADRIFRVSLTSDEPDAFVAVTVANERKPGQLTLVKVNDRDETIPVEGARFSVYSAAGELVQDGNDDAYGLVTDANGEMTVQNLPWGDYYLREIEAPKGYELYLEQIDFTISSSNDAGSSLVIKIADPQKPAAAVLTKYEILEDGVTKTEVTLDGGVYQLYKGVYPSGKLLGTYMTNNDGKVHADDLAFGTYYFLETIAPQGYEKYENPIPFTLDADHTLASCEILTTDTRMTGKVWLQKTDNDGVPVKGAEYGLYRADTDTLVTADDFGDGTQTDGRFLTNDEGIIEFGGLKWNTYYFQETKAPQGYDLDETKHEVVIARDTVNNRILITAHDDQSTGEVRLIKVSEADESVRLAGAEFSLYRSDGSLVAEGLTTDENGELLVSELAWGSYYFQETKAPLGYGLNPASIRFSVNYLTGGGTQELIVTDPEESLELTVTKRIRTADVVLAHGSPTFTFVLTGTDINGNERTMYRAVTFEETYYNAHINDEYLELTALFSGLLAGKYTVAEVKTNRYDFSDIVEISESGARTAGQESVSFNLVDFETGSAVFVNDKIDQELTTHATQVTNVVGKARKLTSITAVWNGGEVTTERLDRTQLDVFANYDDGSSEKLADDAYTLDNEVFDSSMNGAYTITATYEEGGVSRSDSFNLQLNAPIAFTWAVLSEEPYVYDGKTYDGTVCITGYTGSSSVVRFPEEVTGIRRWRMIGWKWAHTYEDNGKSYRVVAIGDGKSKLSCAKVTDDGSPSGSYYYSVGGLRETLRRDEKGELIVPSESYDPVTTIILPEGLLTVGDSAFENMGSLTGSLTIPDSVTSIGRSAFYGCRGINGTLTLPSSLETIGWSAFYDCVGFTGDLVIPDSVTSIDSYAFFNCKGFNGTLTLPGSLETIANDTFSDCSGFIGDLVIPDSVTSINYDAFNSCIGFNGTLTLGSSLETIGSSAFYSCRGFTGDLVIPDSVTYIADYAFYYCKGFNGTLTLGSSLGRIGTSAFYDCRGFTGDLVIPDSVTSIGSYAFCNCIGFNGTLTLSSSLETIAWRVFSDCSGFTGDLVIPDSVTFIDREAFYYCKGFNGTLTLGSSLGTIGDSAFYNCIRFIGDLVIPDSVTSIGNFAFYNCKGFNGTLTLPSSLETIASSAFQECNSFIGDLVIPDSVTSIASNAFYNCKGFNGTLTLPSSLETIGKNAFSSCAGLTGDLVIPDSVTSIADFAFDSCKGFNGTLTLGSSLETIGKETFADSGFTGDLVIPDSVTSIGNNAFYSCRGFNGTLTLGSSLETIDNSAFYDCIGFTGDLVIPDSVTSIGRYAFAYCTGFTGTVTAPQSLTSIGENAFYSTYALSLLRLPSRFQTDGYAPFGAACTVEYYD